MGVRADDLWGVKNGLSFKHPGIRASGHPIIRASGHPGIRASGNPGIRALSILGGRRFDDPWGSEFSEA